MQFRLVIAACVILLVTAMRLRLTTGRWFTRRAVDGRGAPPEGDAMATAERIQRALVTAERRLPIRIRCLERAVTLQQLLRRHGIGTELHIGVQKTGPTLHAHAWIEHDGRVLNDSAARCAGFRRLHPIQLESRHP